MAENNHIPDTELARRCIRADKSAWDQLVVRYTHLVYHVMIRCAHKNGATLRPQEMEDLHNDFFLSLLEDDCRRLRQFQGKSRLSTYLGRIIYNRTVDHFRGRHNHAPLEDLFLSTGADCTDESSPLDKAISNELIGLIRECMPRLPQKDQWILDLRIFQERSVNQIADELDLKVETARARIQRALRKLKKIMDKFD